jgi:hypothetical protein
MAGRVRRRWDQLVEGSEAYVDFVSVRVVDAALRGDVGDFVW